MGIKHRLTTPLWLRANREVKGQNCSLLKAMRVAHAEGRDWRLELKTISSWQTAPTRTQLPARDLLSYFMGGKCPLHY